MADEKLFGVKKADWDELTDGSTTSLHSHSGLAPGAHASTHTNGTDDIQNATNSQKGLATASQITDLEANTSARHVRDHGIASASDHDADTLANFNNMISDATLDGSGDPRPEFDNVTAISGPTSCTDGNCYDNIGATGSETYNLPTCARGVRVGFIVAVNQTMVINVASGDVAHLSGQSTTTAGSITSGAQYSTLWLVGVDSTNWIAMSHPGIWTTA